MPRCAGCRYDLWMLPAGRCPECGREFDPADPRTLDGGQEWFTSRWALAAHVAASMCTINIFVAQHAAWCVGRLTLGHWPRPSVDDPTSIAAVVPFYWLTMALVVALPVCMIAMLILPAFAASGRRWSLALTLIGFAVVAVVMGLVLLRWDPWRAGAWIAD